MSVDTILIVCAMLKQRQVTKPETAASNIRRIKNVDQDNAQRMQICLKLLSNGLKDMQTASKILTEEGKRIFSRFLDLNSKQRHF